MEIGYDDDGLWRPPLQNLITRWYLLIAAGIFGGLLGLGVSLVREPEFESEALLGMNINYGITKPLKLVVEDRVLGRVASVVLADETLQRLILDLPDGLRDQKGWTNADDIRGKLRLDRRLGEWGLVAIDNDPDVATEIAKAWAGATIDALDEAMDHAWRAVALMAGPFAVECIVIEENGSSTWSCQTKQLELDEQALDGALRTEVSLSRGIPPIISYELLRSASVPKSPVIWNRWQLVLAGALFSFIIGVVVVLAAGSRADRPRSAISSS